VSADPPQGGGLEVPPGWWSRLGHDLRGPIAPMRMALQLLQSGRVSAAEHTEAVQLIDRQVDHLLASIDDISELLRMQAGGFSLSFTVDDLNLVIDALSGRSSLRRVLDGRGQQLQSCAAADAVVARHDPQRLVLLLEYLIGKAAEHAAPGALLKLQLRQAPDGAEFQLSGAGDGLRADPDLAHVAGLDMSHCEDRQARSVRMREIARLSQAALVLLADGWTLRLPPWRAP
jgi:signal transduction histidine kinase